MTPEAANFGKALRRLRTRIDRSSQQAWTARLEEEFSVGPAGGRIRLGDRGFGEWELGRSLPRNDDEFEALAIVARHFGHQAGTTVADAELHYLRQLWRTAVGSIEEPRELAPFMRALRKGIAQVAWVDQMRRETPDGCALGIKQLSAWESGTDFPDEAQLDALVRTAAHFGASIGQQRTLRNLASGLGSRRDAQDQQRRIIARVLNEAFQRPGVLNPGSSASQLLTAFQSPVPFKESGGALQALNAWLDAALSDGPAFDMRAITGLGGHGKTRLAIELCRYATEREPAGWTAGFLRPALGQSDIHDFVDVKRPCLIVVDYAETVGGVILESLLDLQGQRDNAYPIRLLLLVRRAPDPGQDWTTALPVGLRFRDSLKVVSQNAVCLTSQDWTSLSLRRELFVDAVEVFSRERGGDHEPTVVELADLNDGLYDRPLTILLAAYLTAVDGTASPATWTSRDQLLDDFFAHERTYWAAAADLVVPFYASALTAGDTPFESIAAQYVALSSLYTAPTRRAALELPPVLRTGGLSCDHAAVAVS